LDILRRKYCSQKAIQNFFIKFEIFMRRDRHLLINVDETSVRSEKRFRVLTTNGRAPITPTLPKSSNITAEGGISGSGYRFSPVFILSGLKNLPQDLEEFKVHCLFLSNTSGWMTRRTFLVWATYFVHQLSIYKNLIPPNLLGQRFLLLIDGHASRGCYEGIDLLDAHGVDVITFPSHSAHVLQVFDISLAAPIKDLYQKFLFEKLRAYLVSETKYDESGKLTVRYAEISSFLEAWEEKANRRNINAGFRKSGILPFDPNEPLSNEHVIQNSFEPVYQRKKRCAISSALLTDPQIVNDLSVHSRVFGKELRIERTAKKFYEILNIQQSDDGRILNAPESFLWWIAHDEIACRERRVSFIAYPRLFYMIAANYKDEKLVRLIDMLMHYNIVFLCESTSVADEFSKYLATLSIIHHKVHGKQKCDVRRKNYNEAIQTNHFRLVLTLISMRGLYIPRDSMIIIFQMIEPSEILHLSMFNCVLVTENMHLLERMKMQSINPQEIIMNDE
jgi:hypothetical protein